LKRVEQYEVLETAILKDPSIVQVAGATNLIGFSNESEFLSFSGQEHAVSIIRVGKGYPETLGLRLNKGTFFEGVAEDSNEILINSMLERMYGTDLLNQYVEVDGEKHRVVGVVDDFNLKSIMLDNKITPTVIKLTNPDRYLHAAVKVNTTADAGNKMLEWIWYEVYPDELYEGFTQELVMENARELNVVFFKINFFLSIITILISILGLYTLISLKIQRKSKEFGVRKVLGASRSTIIHILGKELYWMVSIAAVVGLACGAWVLQTVFDIIYAYHVNPELSHFINATIVVLLIVSVTVGFKVYKASLLNPTQQLRSE